MSNPIHERIQAVARTVFQDPNLELKDETTAQDVEKWDSLNHIAFVVAVEKEFGVKFRNAEVARMKCIGDLKTLVQKHTAAKAA
jgi:acyl carrier protein